MKTACCVVRLFLFFIINAAFRKLPVHFSVMRFSAVVLLVLTLPEFVSAQDPVFSDFKKVPIAPSPNAAALGKFGDIPVSPSTGIPSIQIPIYSYSDKQTDLNLNVALSYHAGGHKVEDMASNVGLGWALQAGGAISRTVKGLADDATNGYINTPALDPFNTSYDGISEGASGISIYAGICQGNTSEFDIVKAIADSQYDGEADIFNISVGEINEKFFFDKNGSVVFVTPNNLYVKTVRTVGGSISKFIVYDARGVSYHFDITESSQTDNAIEPSAPSPSVYVNTWFLSKIESADKKDLIQFVYTDTLSLSYESGLTLSFKTTQVGGITTTVPTYSYNTTTTYYPKRISQIIFPDYTQIDFIYNHKRLDYTGDKGLTSIRISNAHYEKFFRLKYDYFVSGDCEPWCPPPGSANNWQKRLKLLSVRDSTADAVLPPYLFEYNTAALPYRSSKEQDWWGFYNGGTYGDSIAGAPAFAMLSRERLPSLAHAKAWVMERITYPTGGNTKLVYELNEGLQDATVRAIGGLRVKQREDYDPITHATYVKQYHYIMADSTTSGVLLTIPSYTAHWNRMAEYAGLARIAVHVYYNESFNPTQSLTYFSGSPVIYKRVTEQQYVNGSKNGYSVYEFEPGLSGMMHDVVYPFVQKQDTPWARGQATRTDVYNNLGVLLSREENEYRTTDSTPSSSDALTRNLTVGNYFWDNQSTLNRYLYGARDYHLARGKTQLIKTTREEYAGGQINKTVTQYQYDNKYYLPKSVKTTASSGDTIEVRSYYPFNYDSSVVAHAILKQLWRRNQVAEPVSVETWITKGGTSKVRSILVNNYALENTDLLKKNKVYLLESDKLVQMTSFHKDTLLRSPLIKENLVIEKFDARGRGVQFRFTGGERKSLIWSQYEYPIASVDNASYPDIAFTSFETNQRGMWSYAGDGTEDATSVTGLNSYTISTSLTRTGVGKGKFIVSYWKKNNVTVTVNDTSGVAGEAINGWTYYQHIITLTGSSNTVTVSGSTAVIDELRLHPVLAQMTSYTFNVPVGMISSCDANNSVVWYEYDSLGRLAVVRDRRKKILKQLQYNYKGHP